MFLLIIHSDHRKTIYKYFGLLAGRINDFDCSLKNTLKIEELEWVLSQYPQHHKWIKKMTNETKKPIKYMSMFSGIGGFEYGLQQSKHNFKCVSFSEIDKYAISIYLRHFPKHKNYGDATKIRTEELPSFDFLVAGFPCQSYSIAGKRGGFDDTRGTLFFEIARVLKDKRPRYFLLENVRGLLSHDHGQTFQTILKVLTDLGYHIQWQVHNSKYYGVPQNRERIFIKGYLRNKCRPKILPKTRYCSKDSRRIKQDNKLKKIGNVFPSGSQAGNVYDVNGLSVTLSANGGGAGGKTGMYYIPSTKDGNAFAVTTRNRQSKLNKKQDNYVIELPQICRPVLTPDRVNKRQNGRRMKEDGEPSFTLTATDRHGVYDGYRIRRLTPVECERLQGFPDFWTELGKDGEKISDTQRYKCIGNAVTTSVITAIVDEMFDSMYCDKN